MVISLNETEKCNLSSTRPEPAVGVAEEGPRCRLFRTKLDQPLALAEVVDIVKLMSKSPPVSSSFVNALSPDPPP